MSCVSRHESQTRSGIALSGAPLPPTSTTNVTDMGAVADRYGPMQATANRNAVTTGGNGLMSKISNELSRRVSMIEVQHATESRVATYITVIGAAIFHRRIS